MLHFITHGKSDEQLIFPRGQFPYPQLLGQEEGQNVRKWELTPFRLFARKASEKFLQSGIESTRLLDRRHMA